MRRSLAQQTAERIVPFCRTFPGGVAAGRPRPPGYEEDVLYAHHGRTTTRTAAAAIAALTIGSALLGGVTLDQQADPALAAPAARIGIEAGHGNGDPGSLSCDRSIREADITLAVARAAADLLRERGHQVDIFRGSDAGTLWKSELTGYQGAAFVALHTDFCAGRNSGFKIARYGGAPVSGMTGADDRADHLVAALWSAYGAATGLPEDRGSGHFTPAMRYYWAISPGRGVDVATPGAIIEMGWLSGDAAFMASADGQARMGRGIADAITQFLDAPPAQG